MNFPPPHYHTEDEFQQRSRKLEEIIALGIDPYPARCAPTDSAKAVQTTYAGNAIGDSEAAGSGKTPRAILAGRMVLFREMGKNAFAQIEDSSGIIQLMFNRDITQVKGLKLDSDITPIKFIEKYIHLGDFISVEGHLFRTQKGEITLFVHTCTLACKALLPLPDKHKGLTDPELRHRKRWLDLIANKDVRETFILRSRIVRMIRNYFDELKFMEVETPILQNSYGGAAAKPFTTKLLAKDQPLFMRIALEISLKKIVIGGIDRIFEIGKNFRNEGLDRTHNPEFTMLEAYGAYMDYNEMMVVTEKLFEKIALELFGKTTIEVHGDGDEIIELSLKAPWKRLSMKGAILEYGKIDVDVKSTEQLRDILRNLGSLPPAKYEKAARGSLIALLFEETAEKHLIQPHHIIDHPIETTPLCKLHSDPKLREERFVERFETFILGREFCNAYTELNDPVLQRELLIDQAQKRLSGDEEAVPLDEEFIEAICQGLPPCGGLGVGIDRLVMLFANRRNIADVIFFPFMAH